MERFPDTVQHAEHRQRHLNRDRSRASGLAGTLPPVMLRHGWLSSCCLHPCPTTEQGRGVATRFTSVQQHPGHPPQVFTAPQRHTQPESGACQGCAELCEGSPPQGRMVAMLAGISLKPRCRRRPCPRLPALEKPAVWGWAAPAGFVAGAPPGRSDVGEGVVARGRRTWPPTSSSGQRPRPSPTRVALERGRSLGRRDRGGFLHGRDAAARGQRPALGRTSTTGPTATDPRRLPADRRVPPAFPRLGAHVGSDNGGLR